jgi:hypothetical protein
MVLASCGNKYYGTNFIYAVPSSLLIAPSLRTIQFLLYFTPNRTILTIQFLFFIWVCPFITNRTKDEFWGELWNKEKWPAIVLIIELFHKGNGYIAVQCICM